MKKHGNNNLNRIVKYIRIRAEVFLSSIKPSKKVVMPDFLCIGAPRAATTWLHSRLSKHPDIFLPELKELHFFDEPHEYPKTDNMGVQWQRPYYFSLNKKASWKWYSDKFKKGASKIKGDITPAYSTLSTERIQEVEEHLPNLKIIYIIRDPVERAWSGVRRTLWCDVGVQPSESDLDSLISVVMHPEILIRGEYQKNIERWESVFPAADILYLFFDDIVADSQEQLKKVCEFLGVKHCPDVLEEKSNRNRVNMAPGEDMPDRVKCELIKYYQDERAFLEKKFDRNLAAWYQ